jgi:hypothetical protein
MKTIILILLSTFVLMPQDNEIPKEVYSIAKRGSKVFLYSHDENAVEHVKNALESWGYWKVVSDKKQADFVVVIAHGGHEHYELPSPRMKKWYRFFVDAGASAVIGHHTHIISGYETYNEAPIFYSLGNFCFDWNGLQNLPWNKGMMVSLHFEKNQPITFDIEFFTQNNAELGLFLQTGVDKEVTQAHVKQLNEIIINDSLLEQKFNDYVQTWKPVMNTWIQPYKGKYLPSLYKKGLLPSIISKKKKISKSLKGRTLSKEHRLNIGEAQKGISPFMPCHNTRLNSISLLLSSLAKLNCSDFFCHWLMAVLFSLRLTPGMIALNGNAFADESKQRHMGVAAASY